MPTWTPDERSTIAAAQQLELASARHHGGLGHWKTGLREIREGDPTSGRKKTV